MWLLLQRKNCTFNHVLFYKQTKNRNETGSNLSLGTRLTGMEELCGLYERSNDISTFSKGIEYFEVF